MTERERFSPLQPPGPANEELERNTHPADWVNPAPAPRYNLVVIGAGTAGLICAAGAAALGARVALIERELMGGDCLNAGCVPSKALLAAAHRAADVRDAARLGVRPGDGGSVDFPAVMERMRRLRAALSRHDSVQRFTSLGVDVFLGSGRFTGPDAVEVAGRRLNFNRAVIATGTRPAIPAIAGLDDIGYLTNRSLFSLTTLPKRLAIFGAGATGCEMAQAFARFGSAVSLVEARPSVLPDEDVEASEIIRQALAGDGVQRLCGASGSRLERQPDGIHVTLKARAQLHEFVVDDVLVVTGRTPNLEELGLEEAGIASHPHGVAVDDRLRTTNPRVYAAGDVCSPYRFTQAADAMARIVIRNALFRGRAKASKLVIPSCLYTAPELARVGLSARQAGEQGIAIDTFSQSLDGIDRAILAGESAGGTATEAGSGTAGFVTVRTRRGSDRIVGATIVGRHAGEMIAPLAMAMTRGIGLRQLGATILPYPTRSEALRRLGDQYNRSRLTPLIESVLGRWFRWHR